MGREVEGVETERKGGEREKKREREAEEGNKLDLAFLDKTLLVKQ